MRLAIFTKPLTNPVTYVKARISSYWENKGSVIWELLHGTIVVYAGIELNYDVWWQSVTSLRVSRISFSIHSVYEKKRTWDLKKKIRNKEIIIREMNKWYSFFKNIYCRYTYNTKVFANRLKVIQTRQE